MKKSVLFLVLMLSVSFFMFQSCCKCDDPDKQKDNSFLNGKYEGQFLNNPAAIDVVALSGDTVSFTFRFKDCFDMGGGDIFCDDQTLLIKNVVINDNLSFTFNQITEYPNDPDEVVNGSGLFSGRNLSFTISSNAYYFETAQFSGERQ